MQHPRVTRRAVLGGMAALAAAGRPALAQDGFPSRPIRVIVPFGPGSATDIMMRHIAPKMSAALGQSIVVDNRAGAGGVTGADAVVRAAPDGHTLVMGAASSHGIAPAVMPNIPYDVMKDFTYIGRACTSTNFITVHPSVPARTLPELVAYSKTVPGGLSFAAGSRVSSNGLAGEMLKLKAGAQMTHVPYSNINQGVSDVVAGQLPVLIYTVAVMPHVQAGRLRALAVTAETRQPQAPDVPTAVEQGVTDLVADSWFGLFGPPGLPDAIRDRLYRELAAALADPDTKQRLLDTGMNPAPLGPAEWNGFVRREVAKWGEVVRAAGVTMTE